MAKNRSISRKKTLRPFQISSAEKIENKSMYKRSFYLGYDYSQASVEGSIIGSPESFYLLSTNTHYDTYKTNAESSLQELNKKMEPITNKLVKLVEDARKRENKIIQAFARHTPGITRKSFLLKMNEITNREKSLLVEFNQQVLEDIINYSIIKKIDEILKTKLTAKERREYTALRSKLDTITTPNIESAAVKYREVFNQVQYAQADDINAILDGVYKEIGPTRNVLDKLVKFKAGFFNEPLVALQVEKSLKEIFKGVDVQTNDIASNVDSNRTFNRIEDSFSQAMRLGQSSTADTLNITNIPLDPARIDANNNIEIATDVKLSRDQNQYKTSRKVEMSSKLSDLFANEKAGNTTVRESLASKDHNIIFKALASAVLINNNKKTRGGAEYVSILDDYFKIIQKLVLGEAQKNYESQINSEFVKEENKLENRLNLITINSQVFYYSSLLEAMVEAIDEGKLTLNMYGYLTRLLRPQESQKLYTDKIKTIKKVHTVGDNQQIAKTYWEAILGDPEISNFFNKIQRNSQSMKISIKLKTIVLK